MVFILACRLELGSLKTLLDILENDGYMNNIVILVPR
jgi:hypothetical protein